MNIENMGPVVTWTASAAINRKCRVKRTGDGTVGPAGAGEASIGVAQDAVAASGDLVQVLMWSNDRVTKVAASKAIAEGAAVYGAASGQISDAVSGASIGVALHAATAAGDEIPIWWKQHEA